MLHFIMWDNLPMCKFIAINEIFLFLFAGMAVFL